MYELTFLVNPNVSDEELNELINQLRDYVSRSEGQVIKDFSTQKIHLAYPVKKLRQAFLVTVDFDVPKDKIEPLKNHIKTIKSILRHLVITKYPIKILPPKIKPARIKTTVALDATKDTATKPKVKIEELDKKLEELLEE
jgi:small subunit ribosomal protein S6